MKKFKELNEGDAIYVVHAESTEIEKNIILKIRSEEYEHVFYVERNGEWNHFRYKPWFDVCDESMKSYGDWWEFTSYEEALIFLKDKLRKDIKNMEDTNNAQQKIIDYHQLQINDRQKIIDKNNAIIEKYSTFLKGKF